MSKGIVVVLEHSNNQFRKVSYEVLSQGRRLANEAGGELVANTVQIVFCFQSIPNLILI